MPCRLGLDHQPRRICNDLSPNQPRATMEMTSMYFQTKNSGVPLFDCFLVQDLRENYLFGLDEREREKFKSFFFGLKRGIQKSVLLLKLNQGKPKRPVTKV